MAKKERIECTNDATSLKFKGKMVKVQVDPMGLTKHNIPKAQKTAWRYGWIEADNYLPNEFCDRMYELSLIRRRHGFQMSEFARQKETTSAPTGEWSMCCFRQMSANKVFANCPVPAKINSMFCVAHQESAKNMGIQKGRKMIVFNWEDQMHNLVVRGFLDPLSRKEVKGGVKKLNEVLESEWKEEVRLIKQGQKLIDEGNGKWEEYQKTGNQP